MRIFEYLEEIEKVLEYLHGKSFVTLLKLIISVELCSDILVLVGHGFEYVGVWNYFLLLITAIFLGWRSRND